MKQAAIAPAKPVAIQEVGIDSLFKEISEWQDRIAKRAFELFADSGFTDGHDIEDWLKAEKELLKPIAVEVKDSKDEIVVTAQVPSFDAKDLSIQIDGSQLLIEGKHETAKERKTKKGGTMTQQSSQQIFRSVPLPGPVLADKARAKLKNGVLELTLPKAEKAKQIAIAAA